MFSTSQGPHSQLVCRLDTARQNVWTLTYVNDVTEFLASSVTSRGSMDRQKVVESIKASLASWWASDTLLLSLPPELSRLAVEHLCW